jgi:nucleotide-binding universal stress UspA family protein
VPAEGGVTFREIVCGVDFSAASLKALDYAKSVAKGANGRLLAVHVVEWPYGERVSQGQLAEYQKQEDAEAARQLREAAPPSDSGPPVEHIVTVGKAYREIVRLAEERGAGLIALGVQGRTAVDRALFGATTDHVIRQAPCAVLTVRASD